ncbi:MAG: lactate utilization protein [Bacteroidetes bacterium]|nr:lactate utilization protein [Bacteroidota bacterium]
MPSSPIKEFLERSERKAFDAAHRQKIDFNISKYDQTVLKGKQQYSNLEAAREKAAAIKRKVVENLDQYLLEFESNFTKRGGRIIWAEDERQAVDAILGILKRAGVTSVVKSKSMATEEIHLNEALEENNIEPVETDLGEYIVQVAGEKPYHIVTPAMHKSKEEVADLFHKKFGLPAGSSPVEIAGFVRKKLRKKFIHAGAGITGANFLIADIGGIAITENEGNALLTVACPKIHIAVCGIEKLIPSLSDLSHFWPLLATYGTGQRVTVYNSIITGPKKENELDGPEQVYLVLLDMGRTKLLANPQQRQALTCIRCGACLNACPVYKTIGGHSYGAVYSGPIGSVIMPHLQGFEKYSHLSFASSLCGKCSEVCPVKIDIHKQLLENRYYSVSGGNYGIVEKISIRMWRTAMLHPRLVNIIPSFIINRFFKYFFRMKWGEKRDLPEFAPESFRRLWKRRNN